jgi:outer membrane protein OmpA-like peptidoglycan-associated protein
VHFDRHSAVLDADTMATVRAMARDMHARPGARLLVEGLSDGREADPALAYARAEAVRAELTELGIAPSRVHLTSSSVRDAEFDEDDRAANRRVDLFLRE